MSTSRLETTRLLAKVFNIEDFLSPDSLSHDELNYYNSITRVLDRHVDKYVDWLGTPEAQEAFYQESVQRKEYFNSIEDELDEIINDHTLNANRIIEKIYRKGLDKGYKDIKKYPVFNDACKYGLKATQDYNFELITKLSDDLRETIKHDIFKGIAEEKSIHEVARSITDAGLKPLKDKTLTAYQRASLIARTEISRSMSTGRLQAYANYGVEKVRILTAGDSNVCPICLEAAEKTYTLKEAEGLIPFHPACRCSIMAVIEHVSSKILDNPKIMNLTPEEFMSRYNFSSLDDLKRLKELEGWKHLNEEKIPSHLPKTLRDNMISFEEQYKKFEDGNEWAQICNLTTEDVYSIMTNHKPDRVSPFKGKNYGDDEVAMVHNHQDGTFLSPADFFCGFYNNNNIKYVVAHTDNYIYIAQIKNIPNKKQFANFIEEYDKIRGSSSPNECWNMFNSNQITRKYVYVDMVVKL